MRSANGIGLILLLAIGPACAPAQDGGVSGERAARRAFDGAPPTIPHLDLGGPCIACHDQEGLEIPDFGFAPPTPHARTEGLSERSRCRQCHVFKTTDEVFVASNFGGLQQDLRQGRRLNGLAPPVMPHQTLMRENCQACHTGPAAREEIRTPHPERRRCQQCHLSTRTSAEFVR